VDAKAFVEPQFRLESQIFGVLAPLAPEGAALQENQGARAGAVMYRVFIYSFDNCRMGHADSPSVRNKKNGGCPPLLV
jgi:hypothetical protein